jgi:hypothetical protein
MEIKEEPIKRLLRNFHPLAYWARTTVVEIVRTAKHSEATPYMQGPMLRATGEATSRHRIPGV